MGRGGYLGDFEQVVLLAAARLGEEAYGMSIRREIEERTGRSAAVGAVYATLDRLESKGFVQSTDDESGGRARRFFEVTRAGVAALEVSRDMQRRMWAGLTLRRAGRRS